MQIKSVVALSLVAVASAQDLSSLPPCVATTAISNIGSSGCSLTDAKCVCQSQAFISKLGPLVLSACTTAETAANGGDATKGAAAAAKDVAAAKAFAVSYCQSAGVTITFPPDTSASSAPASSAPASSAPASSAPASSAPAPASASSAPASSAPASSSAAPTGGYGGMTTSAAPSASSNSTGVAATSSMPTQTIVPGAAANVAVKGGMVVLAGAFAAVFAL